MPFVYTELKCFTQLFFLANECVRTGFHSDRKSWSRVFFFFVNPLHNTQEQQECTEFLSSGLFIMPHRKHKLRIKHGTHMEGESFFTAGNKTKCLCTNGNVRPCHMFCLIVDTHCFHAMKVCHFCKLYNMYLGLQVSMLL